MSHDISRLSLSFFIVMLMMAITSGLWHPQLDALLVALEALK